MAWFRWIVIVGLGVGCGSPEDSGNGDSGWQDGSGRPDDDDGPGDDDDDDDGGGSGSQSGSGDGDSGVGSGGSGSGGCTPEGFDTAPEDVTAEGFIARVGLVPDGFDPRGFGNGVSFGFYRSDGLPPIDEAEAFANGCPIPAGSNYEGEYLFDADGSEVPIEPVGGANLTLEIRHGDDVIVRRTVQLPAGLPELTAPSMGAETSLPPIELAWSPLGLTAVTAEEKTLTVHAMEIDGNLISSEGSTVVDDTTGTHSWQESGAHWTHLELEASLDYGGDVSVDISHFVAVNSG